MERSLCESIFLFNADTLKNDDDVPHEATTSPCRENRAA